MLVNNILNWILSGGFKILLILVAIFILKKFSRNIIEKTVRKSIGPQGFLTKEAEIKRENTLISIFSGALNVLIWVIGILMILSNIGLNIGPILAGAGVAGIAIGFGAQSLVRDLISGMFIIFENQFRVGDVVNIAGVSGKVENITLRITTLRDLDGAVHHVPNGELKVVSNMTKDFSRMNIVVGIAYDTDIDKMIKVIDDVGNNMANDENFKDKIIKAPHFVRIDNFSDSSIDVRIMSDTVSGQGLYVTGEFRKRLKIAFDENKIEIPFPQFVIHKK